MAIVSWLLITAVLFILGAAVGSFLNVVIYRSVRQEDWVHGRSKCELCGRQLHWYENIPVLSYVIQHGRCRSCQQRIALAHPVVELLTGALFVWWYWGGMLFFQLTVAPFQMLQPLFWLTVGVLLVMVVVADLLYMIIPDEVVGLLMIVTILYRLFLTFSGIMRVNDLVMTIIGMVMTVTFFGGLWLLTKGTGMGMGDVKLVAPLSLLVGWPEMWVAFFIAFISGAMVGLAVIAIRRASLKSAIPFGPFLVFGTVMTLVWGEKLVQWYLNFFI